MAKENVGKFYEALAKDKILQEKIKKAAQKKIDNQMDSICKDEVIPLAKEAGFEFTLAELKEYGKEIGKLEKNLLTDEELSAVAGGGTCCRCQWNGQGHSIDYGFDCSCTFGGDGRQTDRKGCACLIWGGGDDYRERTNPF